MRNTLVFICKWAVIFFLASVMVFAIVRMMPTTPVDKWLDAYHLPHTEENVAFLTAKMGLDEPDELWFPNWDLKAAPWRKDVADAQRVYNDSPHLSVDKWDTPILCIHGMKDYRIMFTQAESAFQAAKMRGIPAQLLLLPDENHWVLHPQNAILWQRTFFGWLDKWLK